MMKLTNAPMLDAPNDTVRLPVDILYARCTGRGNSQIQLNAVWLLLHWYRLNTVWQLISTGTGT